MRVGILGGGRWGQALARLVASAGHEPFIAYRDAKPPRILPSSDDPPKVAKACKLLIVATSADRVRQAIRLAQPGRDHRIVVAGRGLDPDTGAWLTDAVTETCGAKAVGALAGPAPVDEILGGGLCAGVVASASDDVRQMTTAALHSSRYRMYDNKDLVGVQLCGAMMPVLATIQGFATSLRGAGVGVHAMVLSRGLAEATRLGVALGAQPTTFIGLAGVGDLIAAQARPGHASFDAGAAMVRGDRTRGPDGVARALLRLAADHQVELPLTASLVRIYDGASPLDEVQALMRRVAVAE